MTYKLVPKLSFFTDFRRHDRTLQKRIESALYDLQKAPVTPRGDTILPLKHYKRLWRYKFGDYRLVYAAYPERKEVQLISFGPRGDVYKRINYNPDTVPEDNFHALWEQALDPEQSVPPDWIQYLKPQEEGGAKSPELPYRLTAYQLTEWGVPGEYHHCFIGCETEDDLQNCGAPESYIFRLMDCLWPATAEDIAADPKNYILQSPEDLSRYAAGELKAFLLRLDKDQEGLIDWALQGPTLVKGGPGSGKSLVAMYRIRELTKKAVSQQKTIRVLFTTYTNALVEYSKQLIDYLLEDIDYHDVEIEVTTLDSLAMRIVKQFESHPTMANSGELKFALTSGHANLAPKSRLERSATEISKSLQSVREDYLLEEFEWVIEGQGIETLGEYLHADRSGRGYAFSQLMRENVWTLYESYHNFLNELEKLSWGELRKKALEFAISEVNVDDKWDYVLVDEAQDLTPVALVLCMELCKSPTGVFLTADASQSIYNKGFSWINVHESLRVKGRTRILRRNYRTTQQIAHAAYSIIKDTGAGDEEAMNQIYMHAGLKPIIYEAKDEVECFTWLANSLSRAASDLRMPINSIGILAPQNKMVKNAANYLSNYGLSTTYVTGGDINLKSQTAKALTIHSSKGLEFPIVALIYIEEGIIPRDITDHRQQDIEKHLAKENRLLYVGMTRAMRRLFVVYRSGQKSVFLDNINQDLWDLKSFA